MVDMIKAMPGKRKNGRPVRAPLREKSYILQEAEAAARGAKVGWCVGIGAEVTNLQHDGVVVKCPDNVRPGDAALAMAEIASIVCGYEVVVVGEEPTMVD